MERRKFITNTIVAAAVLALPMGHDSAQCLAAQRSLNTFSEDDTLAQRLQKLNALMGTRFVPHLDQMPSAIRDNPKWRAEYEATYMDYPSKNIFDEDKEDGGMGDAGWRVSLWQDGERFTGCMRLKTMFHWTAQVALGYRLAKAQGL